MQRRPIGMCAAAPGAREIVAIAHDAPDFGWIGNSVAAQRVRAMVRRVAPAACTVLIEGKTGTGKDVVAMALHRQGLRARRPLVTINCAAIPETLIEGELFGYRKGAFTGAHCGYAGKIALADRGTLFLDEVGELSLAAQAKLLRVLENREVVPLGGAERRIVDVRIIAATNQHLEAAVAAGRFRADLFYRLAVVRLSLPALASHREDIAPIAQHLVARMAADMQLAEVHIAADCLAALKQHDWPGNVRELRNALEHALVIAPDPTRLTADDLPDSVRFVPVPPAGRDAADDRQLLVDALAACAGKKADAARMLKCSRMTLYRRMERAGL